VVEPPEATEFGGGAPDAETTFTVFSQKICILSIFWSKFLLKNTFKMIAKSVLLRLQGLRPSQVKFIYLPKST